MLNWVKPFNIFSFLDHNHYSFEKPAFDVILAAGSYKSIELNQSELFLKLKDFSQNNNDWLFGHFNYPSEQKDKIDFPAAYFFIPQYLIKVQDYHVSISSIDKSPDEIYAEIQNQDESVSKTVFSQIQIKNKISQGEYYNKLNEIKNHIQRGDCYEINFCQEFYSENTLVDPLFLFHQLNQYSPNPFAAFYKLNDKFCLCASPERFIKKSGKEIISQPIKGTSKRNLVDADKDADLKSKLLNSSKEKSENVMIVDLVRNDLSKICMEGSVNVKELFGIYTFPQVHQMISTIRGEVDDQTHWTEIVDACFPMGSMTGAPKKRVMELIEKYESGPRGLFSGSIGYITPDFDFDFNVVIRSVFYNSTTQYLSFKAGGGITNLSDLEEEYKESCLKVEAIIKVLNT